MLCLPTNLGSLGKIVEESGRNIFRAVRLSELPDGQYQVEATDGKCLARVVGSNVVAPESFAGSAILAQSPNGETVGNIPAKEFAAALRQAPKSKKRSQGAPPHVGVTMGKDVATIVSCDGSQTATSQPKHVDGRWPDTDRVIPTDPPAATVNVTPKLLAELLDVAAVYCGDGNSVMMEVRGPNTPIVLHTSNAEQSFLGILMPCQGTKHKVQPATAKLVKLLQLVREAHADMRLVDPTELLTILES